MAQLKKLEFFSGNLAVGRLGVATSDSRPPRLVVDSSICGVNDRCVIEERATLPSAKDVMRCYPLRRCSQPLCGFSLDIKSAHKRIVVKESEQGLLGFTLQNQLYFYRVCPFGATFSAFWWQRLGGFFASLFAPFGLVAAQWLPLRRRLLVHFGRAKQPVSRLHHLYPVPSASHSSELEEV